MRHAKIFRMLSNDRFLRYRKRGFGPAPGSKRNVHVAMLWRRYRGFHWAILRRDGPMVLTGLLIPLKLIRVWKIKNMKRRPAIMELFSLPRLRKVAHPTMVPKSIPFRTAQKAVRIIPKMLLYRKRSTEIVMKQKTITTVPYSVQAIQRERSISWGANVRISLGKLSRSSTTWTNAQVAMNSQMVRIMIKPK
jgi:hypothetical protein